MEFTGYMDFWFTDVPLIERVEHFAALGIRRLDVWSWRSVDMAALAAECRRWGCIINSTFDEAMGSLADPADNDTTIRTWHESLEMAVRHGVEHLFIFSNQVDVADGAEWTRRLSRSITTMEQYANLLAQTERIMRLVEQTNVEVWVEGLNEHHIQGGVLVHDQARAVDWIRHIDHPQLRLAFDCYHQQRSGGNLIYGLEAYYGLYPTFHIADVPTRQEPGTGEINYTNLVARLRGLGFDGLVGLEFRPSGGEAAAFGKIKDLFGQSGCRGEGPPV
jgi:hydroxypyruvate isomerase